MGAGWFSLSRYLPPRLMTEFHMVEWENWLWNVDFWPHKQTVAHVYILYHRIDKCYFFQKILMLLWMSCMHMGDVWTHVCIYVNHVVLFNAVSSYFFPHDQMVWYMHLLLLWWQIITTLVTVYTINLLSYSFVSVEFTVTL